MTHQHTPGQTEQAALASLEDWARRNAWALNEARIKTRQLISGYAEADAPATEQEALRFAFQRDQGARS